MRIAKLLRNIPAMTESLKEEFFENLAAVLRSASSKCRALDEKFPTEFFESNPKNIYESYVSFLRAKFDENPDIKIADDIESISISEKFANGDYQKHSDAVYRIYHDIKLVCSILIHYYSQGTRSYQMVDKFYKFASELILRECYRVGVQLINGSDADAALEESDFSKTISNDFLKISQVYQLPYAETLQTETKDGHLFSSVISRSSLDKRPKEVPHEEMHIVKILPQASSQPANRLGFVAANTSHIPDPTISPTEIMTSFLHPNWYPLPTSKWLDYGQYQSFAPSISEFKSVTDCSRKGDIWLEKVGYKMWYEMVTKEKKEKAAVEAKTEPKVETKEENNGEKEASNDAGETDEEKNATTDEEPENARESSEDEVVVMADQTKPVQINLKNLFEWQPSNEITEEDIEAFKQGKQQQRLSEILLKLKDLKRKRVKLNKISKPTSEEVSLYHRAQNILREAILLKQVKAAPKLYEKQFPVLSNNYAGGIPVVKTISTRKKKSKKAVN